MISNKSMLMAVMLLSLTFTMSSCEAIGDIFKAGMWFGVIIIVVIVALVLWLISKFRR